MIHLLYVVGVLAAVAAVTYRLAGSVVAARLPRSALAGAAAAAVLTLWAGTVRHAALARSAARPLSDGHKLTPGFILVCGFIGTFAVATAVVFAVTAVLDARRARRGARADGAPAGRRGRGSRRAAVRGW